MKEEIDSLVNNYIAWLHDKTQTKQINEKWVEITTPYLDRHNDFLQIYAKKDDDTYLLTDDGYILNDLSASGCSLDSQKRKDLLMMTARGFGISVDGSQLFVRASSSDFSIKKHSLLQAMLAINDIFFTASPLVASLFFEDVEKWLKHSDARFSSKVLFSGKSGYNHMFDFLIPESKTYPERIIQTLSNPKKDTAENLVFKWIDTRESRQPNTKLYALLNDTETSVQSNVIEALRKYETIPILWTKRHNFIAELVA